MIDQISVVIIVKNGGTTLEDTLKSLDNFKEVILYDNGSTDETSDIASTFSNVVIHQGTFQGFGLTKQAAVAIASNDWVFSLDADEKASPELAKVLAQWDVNQSPKRVGKIRRDNYFMGKKVDKAGWGADDLVRLFNRKEHDFNDNAVHESVPLKASSMVEKIAEPILHNAVQNIGQLLEKVNLYSEIRRTTSNKTYPLLIIFLKSMWRFLESYLIKGGILAGWRGLVISWSNANGVFFKYMKIYADKQD